MEWLIGIGIFLVIAVFAGIVAEVLYGPQDRAMHARERAAQAAHDARMARMDAEAERVHDPHVMAQEALLRAAANNPRGAALYAEYMRGVERQRRTNGLTGGDDRG